MYLNYLLRNLALRAGFYSTRTIGEDALRPLLRKFKPKRIQDKLIRIGGENDGGYLVPDDLEGIEYCFSPGVDGTISFETDLAQRGIFSYLADASIEGPPPGLENYVFDPMFLGIHDHGNVYTLQTWHDKYFDTPHSHEFIMQMDIEGCEYGVLAQCPDELLKKFRIIIVEFHHLRSLFDPAMYSVVRDVMNKMLAYFDVVHVHPNNCGGKVVCRDLILPGIMEVTFLRKDREMTESGELQFPHPLDSPSSSSSPEWPLPKCWYA